MKASACTRSMIAIHAQGENASKAIPLATVALALCAAAILEWSRFAPESSPPASTTVSTYDAPDLESIQAELDRQVCESMIPVAVSPICELSNDGTLHLYVINDEGNRVSQSFAIQQSGRTVFESGSMSPDEEAASCKPEGIEPGEAHMALQGLDPATRKPSGGPAAVQVSIVGADDAAAGASEGETVPDPDDAAESETEGAPAERSAEEI